jgi:hypothetical protein
MHKLVHEVLECSCMLNDFATGSNDMGVGRVKTPLSYQPSRRSK